MEEDKEWSDSSYVLRRRYRLNWSAIIRNVPRGLEGLHETFSKWSVSLGFSLPDSVRELEELCIQSGEKRVYVVSFPSRSSTRSFIRLCRRNIWREISREGCCELYVYCDPPYSMRPFSDFQTMNLSTCYWLIRGMSKEIENDESVWGLLGRKNPFGEFLRRVIYVRDEEGSSGFCFLQFSSPLTSYRALRWELKQHGGSEQAPSRRKYSAPEFIGTSHVKALLLLCAGLDKFETRTLRKVESRVGHLSDRTDTSRARVLQGYLSFWKRSRSVPVPVDRCSEFQCCADERYKAMYRDALNGSGINLFSGDDARMYYCDSLNFLWDWNSRVFMDCQSSSLFEFDPESQSLKFIYNHSGKSPQLVNAAEPISGNYSDNQPLQREDQAKTHISFEKLKKEREIRVASFLENARSQLGYNSINNSSTGSARNPKEDASPDEDNSKRRKITQFFDTSSHSDHRKPPPSASCILPHQNLAVGAQSQPVISACEIPAKHVECGEGGQMCVGRSVSDGETVGTVAGGSGGALDRTGEEGEEELICFVCCRVFGSVWERMRHEQKSRLHKYNLEIWREDSGDER